MSKHSNLPGEKRLADAAWDVLVEECGAHSDDRHFFVRVFDECARMEYRFIGDLGFGGKVWKQTRPTPKLSVSYYPEDKTADRDGMVERANARLAALLPPDFDDNQANPDS